MNARARFSVELLYISRTLCVGGKGLSVPLSVTIAMSLLNEGTLVSTPHVLDAGSRLLERRKMQDELNISFSFAHVSAQSRTMLLKDLNALFCALNVGSPSCEMVAVKGNALNV
jgi:hypothetical protein